MAIDFANRLLKNYKHISKWARKQNIQCYRLYDLDIPSFPLCIDIYHDYAHVAEYKAKHGMDEFEHAEWLQDCLNDISQITGIQEDKVFLKLRERQKGLQQYEKFSQSAEGIWVKENGLDFWVNFTDYLDTGLFLDHRLTRKMVFDLSKGKRVLNLFAYTGSFSVYAAAGGAVRVDTVDMSQTYLAWAEKNMAQNGFLDVGSYQYFRKDIMQWIPGPLFDYYDIVVLDPPTFSNSKKMREVLDIQRDHIYLINEALKALKPGGIMFFSNNYRNFVLDHSAIRATSIKDISLATIPQDFRNKQIHQCYRIEK